MLRLLRLSLIVPIALWLPLPALANPYLVVGSFGDAAGAAKEAVRLHKDLGLDVERRRVEVGGQVRYRLLLAIGPGQDESALRQRLARFGIAHPWRVSIAPATKEAAPTISPTDRAKPVYLDVGRFTDMDAAIECERKLETRFIGVSSRSTFEGDTLYYRVMLGPIDPHDVARFNEVLSSLGVSAVKQVPAADIDDPPMIKAAIIRPTANELQDGPSAPTQEKPPPADDWNPAQLKHRD